MEKLNTHHTGEQTSNREGGISHEELRLLFPRVQGEHRLAFLGRITAYGAIAKTGGISAIHTLRQEQAERLMVRRLSLYGNEKSFVMGND